MARSRGTSAPARALDASGPSGDTPLERIPAGRSSAGRAAGEVAARVLELLTPVVGATGHDLEDVVVTPAGRRRLLSVVVDRDGGVDLDAVAEVTRAVSVALDDAQVMGEGAYVLEVTSPGVGRPLTAPRHWRRAAGRLVRLSTATGTVTGRLLSADEHTATLDVAGTPQPFAMGEVRRAAVEVEFARRDAGEASG